MGGCPPGRGVGGFFHCRWNGRGIWPSRAGPYFFGEIGEKTPRGRRFLPLGTPFSGGKNGGRWLVRLEPGLRPPGPTPHGPPTGSGGREKWFVDGKRKRETERFLSAFSQRVPTHVPSPPSRWAGRYQRDKERAAGRVSRKKYSLPHTPHQRRGSRGRNLLPRGFFPPFLPKKWGPGRAGQGSLPFQRRRKKPATPPARESQLPHPLQQRRELPLPPSPGIWYTEVTTTACPPRQATGRDRLCSATVSPWAPAARWGRCAGTA